MDNASESQGGRGKTTLEEPGNPAPPRRWRTIGLIALIVGVVAGAGVGAYLIAGAGSDASPVGSEDPFGGTSLANLSGVTPAAGTGVRDPERPEEGKRAPNFALIDARDGKTIRQLSDYRGKAVVLNWYASWCGPCKREIPELQRVFEQLGDQLVVLGVDPLESAGKAAGILTELGATYPAVLDSSGEVTDHYRVGKGLPKTYFIDKDGILHGVKTGELRPQDLVKFLAEMGITYKPE